MTELITLSAGLRDPSSSTLLGQRLTDSVRHHLALNSEELSVHVIELRRLARAITDALLTGFPPPELKETFAALENARGLIAVTPAFNASYSGLFKSFFDVLPEETLADMPVQIAATGGTDRHSLVLEHAMRPMFSYLHAIVSPTGVYASTDDFGAPERHDSLSQRIDRAGRDFARLLGALGHRQRRDEISDGLQTMAHLLDHNSQ